MKSNVTFRPTVVLGLGGTGHGVLLRLKKHFIDSFGFVPPCISFLSIDVTEPENASIMSADKQTEVSLDQDAETLILQVPNPANLVGDANPHISQWWPKNTLVSAITSGATQIRPRGRLALFAKYLDVAARVRKAIERVTNTKLINEMHYRQLKKSERSGIDVYIVSSLAGGTGSGMVLDMSFIVRNLIDSSSNVTGMLILPRIFGNDPGIRQKPNSYAALKEIEFFMKIKQGDSYTINYGGDTPVRVTRPPFDLIYLADAINEERNVVNDIDNFFANVAEGLYLLIGSQIGTKNSNALDNIKGKLTAIGRVRGRSATYCSFGIASVVLPIELYKEGYESKKAATAINLINGLLNGDKPKPQNEEKALNLVYGQQLQSNLADFMVESLTRDSSGVPLRFTMSVDGVIDEKRSRVQSAIADAYNSTRGRVHSVVAVTVGENYKRLRDEYVKKLSDWWKEVANQIGGLSYASFVIDKLIAELERSKQYLEGEQASASRRGQDVERELGSVRGSLKTATRPWRLTGGKAEIGNLCQRYAETANKEFDIYVPAEARKKAADLLEAVRTCAEEIKVECAAIRDVLEKAKKEFKVTQVEEKEFLPSQNPFERRLPFLSKILDLMYVELIPAEYIKWHNQKFGPFQSLANATAKEAAARVGAYVNTNVGLLPDYTIDHVLDKMDADERRLSLRQLSELAAPLWCFDESSMPLPHKTIMEACYFGVQDSEATSLKQLDGLISSGKTTPSFITLLDPHRVTLFKVRAGLPLFVLDGMEDMEHAYYDQDDVSANHLDYNWKSFPDIIPLQNKVMVRNRELIPLLKFAIAQAAVPFNLITHVQDGYKLNLGQGPADEVLLGKELVTAFSAFAGNGDLVEKTGARIKEIISANTQQTVRNVLQSLVEQLRQGNTGKNLDFKTAGLVESEILIVEEFLEGNEFLDFG